MTFEQITEIRPAYDCVVVKPCVHGDPGCSGSEPNYSHGRASANLLMTLRGELADVSLLVNTRWDLPETPQGVRNSDGPKASWLSVHSSVPFKDQELDGPQQDCCPNRPECYWQRWYILADVPTSLLVSHGSGAVWSWLESFYLARFKEKS